MTDPNSTTLARDVVLMSCRHESDRSAWRWAPNRKLLDRLGIESTFIDGMRVTDEGLPM